MLKYLEISGPGVGGSNPLSPTTKINDLDQIWSGLTAWGAVPPYPRLGSLPGLMVRRTVTATMIALHKQSLLQARYERRAAAQAHKNKQWKHDEDRQAYEAGYAHGDRGDQMHDHHDHK
jgi:hypothetical protein